MTEILQHTEYRNWLINLKQQIKTGQIKAALSVNSQMIMLYWDLGRQIVEKQENAQWGSGFIEQLSKDLREEFPEMTGFSRTNLFRMKRFYQFYAPIVQENELIPQVGGQLKIPQVVGQLEMTDKQIVAQVVGQLQVAFSQQNTNSEQVVRQLLSIPWGQNVCIFENTKNIKEALFYINKTIENNWSRAVLEYQIETNLYNRQGKAITNFSTTLPAPQSDLANELMKDPYNFDFLQLSEKVKETDLEKALVKHISQFLPELGVGFAYMGRQFSLKIGTKDYRTDLLFYHTRLKSYVIIELKTKEFEPEFVGKLNFYISAINELVKDEHDKPTMGMLLCKNKDNYEVEFSLKDVNNPIGVSTFHYTELADEIKAALPSAEELQKELLAVEREFNK
ncbi:MAG: PDDEXK nuclease domain-containing protein [Bacteroidetes bacterium]|nr:PDDEXK nuclease domain-containing protein [Bacteroidota bacterium]